MLQRGRNYLAEARECAPEAKCSRYLDSAYDIPEIESRVADTGRGVDACVRKAKIDGNDPDTSCRFAEQIAREEQFWNRKYLTVLNNTKDFMGYPKVTVKDMQKVADYWTYIERRFMTRLLRDRGVGYDDRYDLRRKFGPLLWYAFKETDKPVIKGNLGQERTDYENLIFGQLYFLSELLEGVVLNYNVSSPWFTEERKVVSDMVNKILESQSQSLQGLKRGSAPTSALRTSFAPTVAPPTPFAVPVKPQFTAPPPRAQFTPQQSTSYVAPPQRPAPYVPPQRAQFASTSQSTLPQRRTSMWRCCRRGSLR